MPRTKNSRAANGSGSVCFIESRNSSKKWRLRIPTIDSNGKRVYRDSFYATKSEAVKAARAIAVGVDNGEREPSKQKLSEWLKTWMDVYKVDIKPTTRSRYDYAISNQIAPALGSVRLCDLDVTACQRFFNGLNLAPGTIRFTRAVLYGAMEKAADLGYVKSNPIEKCITPRVKRPDLKVLDLESVRDLCAVLRNDSADNLIHFAIFSGLRASELRGLCWDCVDFDNGIVRVEKQITEKSDVFTSTKSGKVRNVDLLPVAADVLKAQKRVQLEQRIAAGDAWTESGLVFTRPDGRQICMETVRYRLNTALARAGLPGDTRIHDLRHGYACLMLAAGCDPKTVSETLGHASASFTLDVYSHALPSMRKAAVEKMNNLVSALNL